MPIREGAFHLSFPSVRSDGRALEEKRGGGGTDLGVAIRKPTVDSKIAKMIRRLLVRQEFQDGVLHLGRGIVEGTRNQWLSRGWGDVEEHLECIGADVGIGILGGFDQNGLDRRGVRVGVRNPPHRSPTYRRFRVLQKGNDLVKHFVHRVPDRERLKRRPTNPEIGIFDRPAKERHDDFDAVPVTRQGLNG